MHSVKKLKSFIIRKLTEELSEDLSYHGVHHTIHVLEVCDQYIRRYGLRGREAFLIRTAALMHDVGIATTYSNHEEASVRFAWDFLPTWGYSKSDLKKVEDMIMATRIPQNPTNLPAMILCDADLDYLGTSQFFSIGNTLFKELQAYGVVRNEEEWDRLQVRFLKNHQFHTPFAQKNREPVKRKYLGMILDKWRWSISEFD